MKERAGISDKIHGTKKMEKGSTSREYNHFHSMNSPAGRILFLQRTIGNRSISRLIDSGTLQTMLRTGQPVDVHKQEDQEEEVHTKENQEYTKGIIPSFENGIKSIRGGGQQLPGSTRSFFEPRFGADFSSVRVHTDSNAEQLARSINSKAFTIGQDVVFGSGMYSPDTTGGKKLLAHELTHVVQQNGNLNHINRWAEGEHMTFGAGASKMKNEKFKLPKTAKGKAQSKATKGTLKVKYKGEKKQSMGLAEANMLSGDYATSPKELASLEDLDTSFFTMVWVAGTNINHFFPLAHQEWKKQHQIALDKAAKAHQQFTSKSGDMKLAENLVHQALQVEGFAEHFLQDSYASGHQYPRAFEAIDVNWFRFLRLAPGGVTVARTYHDTLCILPNGLDLVRGKFHGDTIGPYKTMGKSDENLIVKQTYNSLAEVLSKIAGINPSQVGADSPVPNEGPNIGKIMNDEDAAPIWYSMERSLKQMIENAKFNMDGTITTDSGITYNTSDVLHSWINAHDKSVIEKLNNKGSMKYELIDAVMSGKSSSIWENILNKITGSEGVFSETDDKILKVLRDEKGVLQTNRVPKLTPHLTVMLCKELISGVCIGDDERAVLMILEKQDPGVFMKAVEQLTVDFIDSGLDGGEWEDFLAMCGEKYPAGNNLGASQIIKENDDNAARKMVNRLYRKNKMGNLSTHEWSRIILVLRSGYYGDDDKAAVKKINEHLGI